MMHPTGILHNVSVMVVVLVARELLLKIPLTAAYKRVHIYIPIPVSLSLSLTVNNNFFFTIRYFFFRPFHPNKNLPNILVTIKKEKLTFITNFLVYDRVEIFVLF